MLTLWLFLVFAFVFAQAIQTFAPVRPVFARTQARRCVTCGGRGWVG